MRGIYSAIVHYAFLTLQSTWEGDSHIDMVHKYMSSFWGAFRTLRYSDRGVTRDKGAQILKLGVL